MLLLILCAMVWLALGLRHGRFWQSGPTLPPAVPPALPDEAPAVAIIVPARDEAASITPVLQSLVAQDYPGPFEVVLVDDNSSDGTGDLARAIPGVRVISGAERPAGWAGKLWAVHQGVGATTEPLVLHTDADIIHDPGHLSSLVAGLMAMRVEMVSEMWMLTPDQQHEWSVHLAGLDPDLVGKVLVTLRDANRGIPSIALFRAAYRGQENQRSNKQGQNLVTHVTESLPNRTEWFAQQREVLESGGRVLAERESSRQRR